MRLEGVLGVSYDLVVKNGTVVDGTGLPRYKADVGVKGGKIVAKGNLKANGATVIDAAGKMVAPGFVDIHTHYDGQILWDPLLTCSPWHGVTTVVMGNCGFTLAPCKPQDRDYITEMFAKVEGIDMKALKLGLDWKWQSYPEYLKRIQQERIAINVATMIGHSALRRYVIGPEASDRPSKPDEVKKMKALVQEALNAGAFGFTTSLSPTHYGFDGKPVPSRLSTHDEVLELVEPMADHHVGSVEIITETAVMGADRFSDADKQLMTEIALRTGRPVNWNELSHNWDHPMKWKLQMAYMEEASRQGAQVFAVARCQRLDSVFNLRSSNIAFERWATWKETFNLPPAQIAARLKDPKARAALKAEASEPIKLGGRMRTMGELELVRSTTGKHKQYQGLTLGEVSKRLGKDVLDAMFDIALEENLETEFAVTGLRNGDMEAVAEILRSPYSIAGISDAGAHTNRLSGSNYSTFLLSHWVRKHHLITLEEAVRRLSFVPASIYGMWDRGLIREGLNADIVIFDAEKVAPLPTERFNDFPGGETRLGNRAEGVDYLIVNGQVAFKNGDHTGAFPGKVAKSTDYKFTA
ncbi:MAG: D-aminoacylase [Chloroflexi bacterium]|nr:D-aminoacylase [Chloroflexota bacterium]